MADCGTTGSAIDQAARFFSGTATTTTAAASSHFNRNTNYAQLLEHATSALVSQNFGPQQSQSQQQPQQQHRSTFFSLTPTIADAVNRSIPEYVPAPPLLAQQQQQQATTYHPLVIEDATENFTNSFTSTIDARATSLPSPMSTTSLPTMHNSYHPQQQQQQHQVLQQHRQHPYHAFRQQHHQHQQLMMMQSQNQQLLLRQQQINMMLQQQQQQQQQTNAGKTIDTINIEEQQQQQHQGHDGIVQPASIQELSSAWRDAVQQVQPDVNTTADDVTTIHQNYDSHDIDQRSHTEIGATFNDLASAWAEAQLELQNELNDAIASDDNNMWSGEYNEDGNKYQFTSTFTATAVQEQQQQQQQQDGTDILTTNYMEEGYREFNAGNIRNAIHLFEMELQQIDLDNAAAWCMLGKCHAENDMDTLAIQCFEEAVVRDPYNIEALLALGVSYVNELNHVAALKNLKEYILNNPKFANLDVNGDTDIYGTSQKKNDGFYPTSTDAAFDDVQRLLLSALDYQMQQNRDDHITTASVLEALGVVYNVSRDYDAAIDVFQQGCALRPDDYTLWNKLGATLANSGEHRSEEALLAYHQALKIKPKYARAWLNMAIAHSNVQQYHDAARCYLQTLAINPNAVHCWSFLRIALSCLEMNNLIPATASQNIEAFREHFDFTSYTDSLDNPTVIE